MRWSIMLDMWTQHNHELLTGSLNVRGMPGVRPGYRIDRPEMNMSFYAERVSHQWRYPGNLSTQIGVIRGQPSPMHPPDPTVSIKSNEKKENKKKKKRENVLFYYPPEADKSPHKMQRSALGRMFSVNRGAPNPAMYTGESLVIQKRKKRKLPTDTNGEDQIA